MDVMQDPLFTVRARDGSTSRGSLADVFATVDRDDLLDLPAMLPHQRLGVVTGLSAIKAVLSFHLEAIGVPDPAAKDYTALWLREVGPDGGLVVAPDDLSRPGFLQPPLTDEPTVEKVISGVDLTFADLGHETKPRGAAEPEDWVFALLSGMLKQFVKDNPSGARWGVTGVLPSDGESLGSEVSALERAYRGLMDGAAAVRDHFLWLLPWGRDSDPISSFLVPRPFLEAPRPVRLICTKDVIAARQLSLSSPRVDVKSAAGNIGDPHVPVLDGSPYRVVKGRRFDVRYLLAILSRTAASGDPVETPILEAADTPWVRVCAVGSDQGKTLGYHEEVVRRPVIDYSDESALIRLRDLAHVARSDIGAISAKALAAAVAALLGIGSPPTTTRIIRYFEDAVRRPVALWLADRAPLAPDENADREALAAILVPASRYAFERAVQRLDARRGDGPLRIAAATRVFNAGLRAVYPRLAIAPDRRPDGVVTVERIITKLNIALYPDGKESREVKALRTMLKTCPPLDLWTLLQDAGVPREHLDDTAPTEAWMLIARGMANLPHAERRKQVEATASPDGGIGGWWLRQLEWPQFRMQRMLDAEGAALRALAEEAWRFVRSRRGSYDWRLLAGLIVSDALGDDDAADWCRRRLALTYTPAKRGA